MTLTEATIQAQEHARVAHEAVEAARQLGRFDRDPSVAPLRCVVQRLARDVALIARYMVAVELKEEA